MQRREAEFIDNIIHALITATPGDSGIHLNEAISRSLTGSESFMVTIILD